MSSKVCSHLRLGKLARILKFLLALSYLFGSDGEENMSIFQKLIPYPPNIILSKSHHKIKKHLAVVNCEANLSSHVIL